MRQSSKNRPRNIRVLFDTGATGSFIRGKLTRQLRVRQKSPSVWKTGNGPLTTSKQAVVQFLLPELYADRVIEHSFNVLETAVISYDMIIGTDLMRELGLKLDFKDLTITWDEAVMPFKNRDDTFETGFYQADSTAVLESTERIKRILDAKYEKIDVREYVKESKHLTAAQQDSLAALLERHEKLFDGTLGNWKSEDYDIELKEGAKPCHARAYPIPKAYEQTLKVEVQRLCTLDVLKKVNRSEWGAPTFIIPKKDGTVRFISDFRELNKRIKQKPFPIPKIQDLLLKLEGFQYATSLDLNMGYYHIELSPKSKQLCTIVLPWGKYEYQQLPMGLANSPDIFQEKMSELMYDLEYVRTYLDDILAITSGSWEDHLDKLEEVLIRLEKAGLKVNARKSFFGQSQIEYLHQGAGYRRIYIATWFFSRFNMAPFSVL